jgi:ComF family protein
MILDLIFPKICSFCNSLARENIICDFCLSNVRLISGRKICSTCGLPFGLDNSIDAVRYDEHVCGKCLTGTYYFNRARSVALYEGWLREILHRFKYHGKLGLGRVLSRILAEHYPSDLDDIDLIVTVPLHIGKLRTREFNQSVVMAKDLAKRIKVPFNAFALKKVKGTRPQYEMGNETERRRNVRGAFIVEDSRRVRGKSILLLDDVFTTGSTLNECTRVLLKSGVIKVQVLTLMRTIN